MFNKIKNLLIKKQEIVLYIFFGGLTTLVAVAVRIIALYFGGGTALAVSVSWVCAVTFAFFTNKIFVFKNVSVKISDWFKQAAAFYGARATTYFLDLGFTFLMVNILRFNEYIITFVVQIFILTANYLLSKKFIFKQKEKKQ